MNSAETLKSDIMKKEECNLLLYEIILAAAKDYKDQDQKWVDYKMCQAAHDHFPDWISATSLRTAKTAARAIKEGKTPAQLTKCSAVDGFLAYLFHRIPGYKFPSVRKIIEERGGEYLHIINTEPSPYQPPVPTSVLKEPLQKLSEGGNFGDKLIRLGEHVRKLEDEINKKDKALKQTKSHLDLLIEKNESIETQQREHQKLYSAALEELQQLVNNMEIDAELKGESLENAQKVIHKFKRKIDLYKSAISNIDSALLGLLLADLERARVELKSIQEQESATESKK